MGFGTSSSGPAPNQPTISAYQQLLGLNQSNYNNILSAYNTGQQNIGNSLQGIYSGYNQLSQGVMNTLGVSGGGWGVAQPAADAIAQAYSKARGATTQGLVNSGLGNTTLLGNLQNQNAQMAGQSYGNLGSQLASTAAGYQAQLGQARLGSQMQGLGMQTQLQSGLGNALAGYHFQNTAGPLTGQQSFSRSGSGEGGSGGGGGNVSGSNAMLGWGGLGATALGWMGGGNPGVGLAGAYSQPNYWGQYGGQGGSLNGPEQWQNQDRYQFTDNPDPYGNLGGYGGGGEF